MVTAVWCRRTCPLEGLYGEGNMEMWDSPGWSGGVLSHRLFAGMRAPSCSVALCVSGALAHRPVGASNGLLGTRALGHRVVVAPGFCTLTPTQSLPRHRLAKPVHDKRSWPGFTDKGQLSEHWHWHIDTTELAAGECRGVTCYLYIYVKISPYVIR